MPQLWFPQYRNRYALIRGDARQRVKALMSVSKCLNVKKDRFSLDWEYLGSENNKTLDWDKIMDASAGK